MHVIACLEGQMNKGEIGRKQTPKERLTVSCRRGKGSYRSRYPMAGYAVAGFFDSGFRVGRQRHATGPRDHFGPLLIQKPLYPEG